jgi:hypothetical protein
MSFTFNPAIPDFSSKDAARVYSIGKYHALLVIDPPMLAAKNMPNIDKDLLITYLYAMVVSESGDLKMIITSEITSQKIMSVAADEIKNELKRPSLCIFNEDGSHDDLGKFADWSNIELFCNKCFELIGERFGETSKPVCLSNKPVKRGLGITSLIRKWHFGKIVILLVIYAVLLIATFEDRASYHNSLFYPIFFIATLPLAGVIWIWLSGREK